MVTTRGKSAVRAYIGAVPGNVEKKLLPGAARAAANVVADEARRRTQSSEVRASVKVAVGKDEGGRTVGKVQTKGPGAHLAPWEEYGTEPHLISIDDSQRNGMSINRINRLAREGDKNHSLIIGGKFVGATVMHPGARPHPFMRPSLDTKEGEALAAAQAYINGRVSPAGIKGGPEGGDE
jgi:hypothetical protein